MTKTLGNRCSIHLSYRAERQTGTAVDENAASGPKGVPTGDDSGSALSAPTTKPRNLDGRAADPPLLQAMERFPKEARKRAESALDRIERAMHPTTYATAGGWWTLKELAGVGQCSEAAASARLRDLRRHRRWNVERLEESPGLWVYRLNGKRPPGASESRGAVAELRRELAELRRRLEDVGVPNAVGGEVA